MGMGGRIGGQGGYEQPQYGGGYPAGPGKGRAPMAQPPSPQSPVMQPTPVAGAPIDWRPPPGGRGQLGAGPVRPTEPVPRPRLPSRRGMVQPMPFSSYGSPGKGMRPQPYGGGFGRGFGGGFGGYQPSPYMPPSPYGGSFGGVFNQGYGVPRGIGSLLSSYPSYMPPRMHFNPYVR